MSTISYALCKVCLASRELSTMVSLGERQGYVCPSCAQNIPSDAQTQAEAEADLANAAYYDELAVQIERSGQATLAAFKQLKQAIADGTIPPDACVF